MSPSLKRSIAVAGRFVAQETLNSENARVKTPRALSRSQNFNDNH